MLKRIKFNKVLVGQKFNGGFIKATNGNYGYDPEKNVVKEFKNDGIVVFELGKVDIRTLVPGQVFSYLDSSPELIIEHNSFLLKEHADKIISVSLTSGTIGWWRKDEEKIVQLLGNYEQNTF